MINYDTITVALM